METVHGTRGSTGAGLLAAAVAVAFAAAGLDAQAYDAPAFHPPHADRGLGLYFTFLDEGDAPGAAATWRRTGDDFDWGLRAGAADFAGAAALMAGGDLTGRVIRAGEEFPLTVDWVTGAGLGVVPDLDRALLRIPAGLTLGRRLATEDGFTLTPYAHPRLGLDFLFRDTPPGDDTDLDFDIEFGVDVDLQETWGLRFGFVLGEHEAVGGGLIVPTF